MADIAEITSIRELSPKAASLLLILYKEYLDKLKTGISKSEALAIGDINHICKNLTSDLSQNAVEKTIDELCNNNLIFKSLWGYVALKIECVNFCEKNNIKL